MILDRLLLLCRPGFEKECAAEMMEHAQSHGFYSYIKTKDNSGFVLLVNNNGNDNSELFNLVNFPDLIFPRQWLATSEALTDLPENDRITPIINHIKNMDIQCEQLEFDYADTNEGKSIQKFCTGFRPHLEKALQTNKILSKNSSTKLHLFFINSTTVYIGFSFAGNNSPYEMGLMRLKMPGNAPSRSTLKLDEAINWFIPKEEQAKLFTAGMKAVDLGAAPGGWSWQLANRGLLVTAIDNGPMDETLMQSGMVDHYQVDAFKYMPDHSVDWMVCDMVEQPLRVSKLITQWFTQRKCKQAIFNLKLPMKKKLQTITECRNLISLTLKNNRLKHRLQTKHLYHDRDEVTVYLTTQ